MRSNARWEERIGAVFVPEADEIAADHDHGAAAGAQPVLKQGCYTVQHTPTGAGRQGSRFRGTLRVELAGDGPRISGDLYRYRGDAEPDEAAELTTIPVYSRRSYNSYLRGTGTGLLSTGFTLDFEQFTYRHPASGFDGSFPKNPSRRVRFTVDPTPTVDLFQGQMHVLPPSGGQRLLGEVSIRWISPFFRRATVQLNTLTGAIPPGAVDGTDIRSIFTAIGWDLTVDDGGSIGLPPALSRVIPTKKWSEKNLHTLMRSVPGYDPAGLDAEWRVHLLVVPATMGCNRGLMFDTEPTDSNGVPREGAATFSHDGYRPEDFGPGGTDHFDAVSGKRQHEVPRAYLRSATHEVGHAFNQIHQGDEGGIDNSIMSSTASVASVLGAEGTFPDGINLAFNDTVTRHLRHYPDPAVRPGAMEYFGDTINAPEPADVDWVSSMRLDVVPSTARARLGQPITLEWTLTNAGAGPVPVPDRIDTETLIARVNVTDASGRITFMRPPALEACSTTTVVALEPGAGISGSTILFWGTHGFAFETPGRHRVEVVLLWRVAGVPMAAEGETDVFVEYPVSEEDNEVAALMLHSAVGRAICAGDVTGLAAGGERVRSVLARAGSHPAGEFLREHGVGTISAPP
jgi:hypothetical protein